MKRKNQIKYLTISTITLVISFASVVAIYHSSQIDIEIRLKSSLRVAIDENLNTRFANSDMRYSTSNTNLRINKRTTINDEKGECRDRSHCLYAPQL